jgi:hypothetical protein
MTTRIGNERPSEPATYAAAERPARYFAIVIRGDDSLGGVLSASTELGNWIRQRLGLPAGFAVTRSIEISKSMAERTW